MTLDSSKNRNSGKNRRNIMPGTYIRCEFRGGEREGLALSIELDKQKKGYNFLGLTLEIPRHAPLCAITVTESQLHSCKLDREVLWIC